MQQIINQNIQPVVYNNQTYPLTFAYVIAQSSILNANPTSTDNSITENTNYCLPKGLSIRIEGPASTVNKSISNLTRNSTTVTATSTAHNLTTGTNVTISGASPSVFNGSFSITVTGPNTFTYTVATAGTDTATGTNIIASTTISTYSNVAVEADRLVWITGKGAYLTQEGVWIPVPEITNLLNNSTKIYGTDKNGSYLVFDTSDIADPFNQLKLLQPEEGYLIISNKAGQIPNYIWYDVTAINPEVFNKPKVSFIYNQCNTVKNVNNNQKAINLKDIGGACDSYKKAGVTLKAKLEDLKKGYHYRVEFSTDHPNTVFENTELYYGNNQLKYLIINNNIDIMSDLTNNIVTLNIYLYENDLLINTDTLSIYINCQVPPAVINPPMVRPRFYLIGE